MARFRWSRLMAASRPRSRRPPRPEPYFWFAEVAKPAAGKWQADLPLIGGCGPVTREIVVDARKPAAISRPAGKNLAGEGSWNSTTEALFSAWIEKLFDAPPDQDLSWKVWSEVLRDQSRNFLFNYLGRGEDNVATGNARLRRLRLFPARLFRFQNGAAVRLFELLARHGRQAAEMLPMVRHRSSRGNASAPPPEQDAAPRPAAARPPPEPAPRILGLFPRSQPPANAPRPPAAAQAQPKPRRPTNFAEYLRDVGDVVHTGAVRVVAADDNTDFYTVPLTRKALHPGTVYADPYGHVLMLVHLVPEQDGKPGVFLAVDAEPDGSITRKRFWRGNFLFVHDPALGSPGFKRFRPIVGDKNGPLRRLTNAEIAKNPQYGDFSLEQSQMSAGGFLRPDG